MATLPNDRHERFCLALVASPTWDVSASYTSAGYTATGESARVNGQRLLQKATVQARIAELQEARAKRMGVDADTVLRELLLVATSSVDHYTVDEHGSITLVDAAPAGAVRAVSSVKVKTTTTRRGDATETDVTTEYRLWPKVQALDLLGKHLGIYEKDNSQKTPGETQVIVIGGKPIAF